MKSGFAIGIDLGATNIKLVAIKKDGTVLKRRTVPTQDRAAMPWADHIKTMIDSVESEIGQAANWIGLAAPGLAARDRRSIAFMPERLQGLENVILLTLGTGVGGAILSRGELMTGTIGRAGHLGHICLDTAAPKDIVNTPGSIEMLMGDYTAHERSQGLFYSTKELVAAHLAGNQNATEIWTKSVYELSCAMASLINVLDPEAVIIGGGISSAGEALFAPLRKFMDAVEWRPGGHRVKIIPAQLGDWAGAFGAARFAMLNSN